MISLIKRGTQWFFDRFPLLSHVIGIILRYFFIWIRIILPILVVVVSALVVVNVFGYIENALMLKYNSPFFRIAPIVFVSLAGFWAILGWREMKNEYKRPRKPRGKFYKTFSSILRSN